MSEEIVLGGGCFWCVEAAFKEVEGVTEVTSGYAGGRTENPSYSEVSSGDTGHAEVVKIEFNPETVGLERLLEIFFKVHDPTTEDRQGPDIGSQYRSIILYRGEEQRREITKFLDDMREQDDEIVTEVVELDRFYRAEERHQDYFEKNSEDAYCQVHVHPKVDKVREELG